MRNLLYSGATIALALSASFVNAVPVHINSGNPAFPFPQFLEYSYGSSHNLGNLANKNPEGVVHAEMEQDIRDAYQVHANEFKYTGVTVGGYKYIETPYKSAYDCTEGDGYGLLAAAYMGDVVTFNGYWMCTHDKRRSRSKSYSACSDLAPNYQYGPFALGDHGIEGNTAADGDVDVALALYVAYKQWGEFMRDLDGNIVNDACGNPISYKEAMIEVIRGLVALSTKFPTEDPMRVNTGMIGLDGYPKGGDTWNEQTKWATANPTVFTESKTAYSLPGTTEIDVKGKQLIPEFGSGDQQHIDYNAPAYFREFYELFEELGGDPWEIEQFRKGESSSDWLIGKLIGKSKYSVPTAGWCTVSDDGSQTTFTNFNQGEDYRCSWRTIANYVWHGNPEYTWDPASHKVINGGNTYEYDAAVRLSDWMNDPSNWNPDATDTSRCINYGSVKNMPYSGPATIRWQNDPMTGVNTAGQDFYCSLSMQTGTGSYAAVGAQDYELMGLVYRECNIKWDTKGDAEDISAPASEKCNIGKTSNYMHGWARQMGMMVVSGNYHAPSAMTPKANMKIYRAIKDSITYCYTGDSITFLLSYRNYGSVDAEGVKIVETLPDDFIFVKANNGGVYNSANRTITWNIGDVSGFKSDNKAGWVLDTTSANYKKTVGLVSYICKAGPNASGRYCTTADITCTNGLGWTTNEYPNYQTATMQRNCVDVVKRSLIIEKSVDRPKINPDNVATFNIDFENSSEAGWIDGGRPRVNVSWACEDQGNQMGCKFRLFNDAIESYINYGNYRISYYLYDPTVTGVTSGYGGNGWSVVPSIYEGGDKTGFKITHEDVVEGVDETTGKKWNQRLSMQFAPLLVTTTMVTSWNTGNPNCTIHKGGDYPLRVVNLINGNNYSDKVDWSDDWSMGDFTDTDGGLYYPITPSWQRLDEKGATIEKPVTKWIECGCSESPKTVPNVLVEEYDGYVWRRVLGNGPMAGRDVENVYIRDTLPKGMEFVSFIGDCPLEENGAEWKTEKTSDGRDIIIWYIPKMQVKQKGSIKYNANITFPSGAECQTDDEDIINAAWISADKNSPISDTALITVTCAKVPEPIVPTTMHKSADKENYEKEDPITYTIEYEQTHGSIFNDAAKTSSDWTLTNAGSSSVSGGKANLSMGANAKFKYSKSSNIFISADCNVNQGSSNRDAEAIIYFRDNIRFGIYVNYDGGGATILNCYQGSALKKSVTLPSKNTSMKINAELNGDIMRVWIGKDTSKLASFSVDGLPTNEGYFGFEAPSNGSCAFSNIHVHTDYAYDLTIVDRKPDEIDFVSADEGGTLLGDSIVWKFEQGIDNPIPFGKKYTVTWEGKVEDCKEMIINYAYVRLLGHKDGEIAAQAESKCIDESCEGVQKAELTIKETEICAGDSTVLKAVGSPKSSKYEYEFFLGNTSLGDPTTVDSFIVKEMGDYKVKISDPSCPTANPAASLTVSLTVNALPDAEITDKASICKNESLDLSKIAVEDHTIEWYGDITKTIVVDAEDIPADNVRNTYYYVLTDNATGCKGEAKEWEVVINPVPSTPKVKPEKELPLKKDVKENITNMASPSGTGNHVVWYNNEDDAIRDSISTPVLVDLGTVGHVSYYVRELSPEGCIGDPALVSVIVTESQKPRVKDTTICIDKEIDVTTLAKADDDNTLVWYDDNDNVISGIPANYTATSSGEKIYKVAQKNEAGAISDKAIITITAIEVTPFEDAVVNYCARDNALSLTNALKLKSCSTCKDPSSYNFYLNDRPVDNIVPETNVSDTKLSDYKVEPIYKISQDNVCVGQRSSIEVNVEYVQKIIPAGSIHYTISDAVDGKFLPLTEQDNNAVVPTSETNKLVWYDSNDVELGETAPSPELVTNDTTITYKVKQVSSTGCESELSDVTVIITKTPIPDTKIVHYCEDEDPDPIETFASVTNSAYSLIWYDKDPKDGGVTLTTPPTIITTADPGKPVTINKYYVAQGNTSETSSASFVEVRIYAKPELITKDTVSCEKSVNINGLWSPAKSIEVKKTKFFSPWGTTIGQHELVSASGVYNIQGFISVSADKECQSKKYPVTIEIHSLGTIEILGEDSVCPNSIVNLAVSSPDTIIFGSPLSYVWNKPNNSTVEGEFISDPISEKTDFAVTVSDGVCTQNYNKTVKISKGKVDGKIEISEGTGTPVVMNATPTGTVFYSCGEDVRIVADVTGSGFTWDDNTIGNTITKKESGVYTLTYTNGCETSLDVEIISTSIKDFTTKFDTIICEGETVILKAQLTAGTETPDIVWKKDNVEVGTSAELVLKKVTSDNAGVYTYEATKKNCTYSDAFGQVTVNPRPVYTLKEVTPICAGNTLEIGLETLSPSTAEVEWETNPTLTVSTDNKTAEVSPNNDETYRLTISQNGGCTIKESINVKVNDPISFHITGNDTTICENNIGNLKFGLKIDEGDVLSYVWKNDKDSVVSESSLLRFTETKVGTYKYTVVLTSEACPSDSDNIEVTIAGLPMIDTVKKIDYHNVLIVPNTEYGKAPYEYMVNNNDFSSSDEAYVAYGRHVAVIRDANGCMNEYPFILEAPNFEIPIVVSPNNDGVNDSFISEVISEAYPDAVVTIYDRFGKKLTEIKGNESWDGTYQGHKMPSTDYWYEIWIEEIAKKYVGHFTLIND